MKIYNVPPQCTPGERLRVGFFFSIFNFFFFDTRGGFFSSCFPVRTRKTRRRGLLYCRTLLSRAITRNRTKEGYRERGPSGMKRRARTANYPLDCFIRRFRRVPSANTANRRPSHVFFSLRSCPRSICVCSILISSASRPILITSAAQRFWNPREIWHYKTYYRVGYIVKIAATNMRGENNSLRTTGARARNYAIFMFSFHESFWIAGFGFYRLYRREKKINSSRPADRFEFRFDWIRCWTIHVYWYTLTDSWKYHFVQ